MENQTGKPKTGLSLLYRETSISVSKKMYLFKDTFYLIILYFIKAIVLKE